MEVAEYTVVFEDTKYNLLSEFTHRVNDMIAQGWQPIGGVSIAQSWDKNRDEIDLSFCQAMVKYPSGIANA